MFQLKIVRVVLVLTVVISLTACNLNRQGAMDPNLNTDEQQRMQTNQTGPLGTDMRNTDRINNRGLTDRQNQGMGGTNQHRNTRVEMSEEIAEQIADMAEIDRANVFLTDENAYIAVVLENNGNRTSNQNRGNEIGTRNRGNNQGGRMGFNQQDEVTEQIKEKIASQVKSVKPDINNVFVSANPDFLNRMNGFVDQVQDGRPLRGFMAEFNTLVERIFPTNEEPDQGIRGTGNTSRPAR
jgi:YhcN/YlaJ family sporulation lipoprotein